MGIMAGVGGLVGGLSGLFGGNNMPSAPPQFIMPNQMGAANSAYNSIGNLTPFTNAAGGTPGLGSSALSGIYNNPGASPYTTGAYNAMGMGQAAAGNMFNAGGATAGYGSSLAPMAGTIMNLGLDPQSQLYNFAQNQNLQQSQAIEAGAGLATTPYGAGVSALSNQQFNMNWENQQLGRAESAAGTAGNLLSTAGNLQNMGTGMQGQASNLYGQASAMPYNAYNAIGNNQLSGLSQYLSSLGAGAGVANMPFSDYMSYVGAGNQANSVANQNYQAQLQAQNQGFNQQLQLGGLLGGSLYNLSNGMGGMGLGSMFGGANPFAAGGIFSSQPGYINASGDLMQAGQVTPG